MLEDSAPVPAGRDSLQQGGGARGIDPLSALEPFQLSPD
jgi:hypothetical protein